jgi:hypothetical protein
VRHEGGRGQQKSGFDLVVVFRQFGKQNLEILSTYVSDKAVNIISYFVFYYVAT